MRLVSALILSAALALGACNRHQPEEAPAANNVAEAPVENAAAPPPPEAPANAVENATPPAPPPPKVSEDQQMRDDADATGLTARLPDGEAGGQSENQTRPAE